MKNNLINQNNKKKENNYNNNCTRSASVEERFNNPHFSHNLEKEYLNVRFIVKNSVEKINTLFNNEEFKQKTTSKKIYNNISNRININRCDLNKDNNNNDNFDKDENKKDSKINTLKYFINVSRRDKNKKLSKFSVNEEDEYAYNSNTNTNDLFKELKDLNSNKNKNSDIFTGKKLSLKTCKSNEIDSINGSGSLLNLESNKLYSKKEQNLNLKKINISENTNLSMKNKDKKYKNPFISNNLKTEIENDFTGLKDKKKDILKFVQKGNRIKKSKQNPINLKTRNSNKPKVFSERCTEEESNRFSNTQKFKNVNNSLQKDINSGRKNNSNSMLIDINLNINSDNNNLNINNNIETKTNKEHNKLLSSIGKHLYKGEKREIAINDIGKNGDEYLNNKKYINENKNKKTIQKNENNIIVTNKNNAKKITEKIKTQDYMKSLLILNEYLLSNNLFEDNSNIQNKKIINDLSLFLANNIKNNNNNSKQNKTKDNKMNEAATKIQKKWRQIKIEKYLINNFMEEDFELKKMLINDYLLKSKIRNNKIIDIFYNIINNYKLIYNNIEDIDKIFDKIQKVIQRKLTINEENLLYKEYINKVICKK